MSQLESDVQQVLSALHTERYLRACFEMEPNPSVAGSWHKSAMRKELDWNLSDSKVWAMSVVAYGRTWTLHIRDDVGSFAEKNRIMAVDGYVLNYPVDPLNVEDLEDLEEHRGDIVAEMSQVSVDVHSFFRKIQNYEQFQQFRKQKHSGFCAHVVIVPAQAPHSIIESVYWDKQEAQDRRDFLVKMLEDVGCLDIADSDKINGAPFVLSVPFLGNTATAESIAQRAVEFFNEVHQIDSECVSNLLTSESLCNFQMVEHPTVIVRDNKDGTYSCRGIGLVNGLLHRLMGVTNTAGPVAMLLDDNTKKLTGFSRW